MFSAARALAASAWQVYSTNPIPALWPLRMISLHLVSSPYCSKIWRRMFSSMSKERERTKSSSLSASSGLVSAAGASSTFFSVLAGAASSEPESEPEPDSESDESFLDFLAAAFLGASSSELESLEESFLAAFLAGAATAFLAGAAFLGASSESLSDEESETTFLAGTAFLAAFLGEEAFDWTLLAEALEAARGRLLSLTFSSEDESESEELEATTFLDVLGIWFVVF